VNGEVAALQERANDTEIFQFGPYRLVPAKRLLLLGGENVELGSRAFDTLALLVRHRGEVLSRRQIIAEVWPNLTVDETNLRAQIAQLRRALAHGGEASGYVKNVRGRGYVFVAPVQLGSSSESRTQGAVSSIRSRLPGRQQRLVGRRQALDAICSRMRACRFMSLVGAGGIGKTTLAIELGHRLAGEFGNQICYVDLGSLKAPDLALPTVAVALGYTVSSDDLLPGLTSFLADRHLLLILDCCEHVIEAVASLAAALFRETPKVHLLATSREPLRAEGETVQLVGPLELPVQKPDLTAAEALAAPSVQLFMQRAAASGFMAELEDGHAAAVSEICRQLDGNPLAIELAGSRLITYGFSGLLESLGGSAILAWPGRRHDPRHRTLAATLDWSYRLLSEVERRVLARLSVFVGTFTMQAAQAVASDDVDGQRTVARAVEELADKSLVAVVSVDGLHLYRLLDVMRFYAEMKLDDSDERLEILRRHARFCADLLESRKVGPRHVIEAAGRNLGMELGNVRVALEWCFSDSGDVGLGIDLAAQAARMLLDLSMLRECLRWCRIALAHLGEEESCSRRALRLQESLALSKMYTRGNDELVGTAIERGLEMAVALKERESELHLLAGYNLFLTRRADFLGALGAAQRFAALAHASQDPVEIVASDWMLASTHNLLGRQRVSQELQERGFARAEAAGIGKTYYFGFDNKGRAFIGRAWTAWLCGMPEKALRWTSQVLDASVAQNHPVSLCIAYLYSTSVVLWLRDLDWAERLIEALIEVATKHQLKPYRTGGLALKGELMLARGRVEAGVGLLQGVLEPLRAEQLNIALTPALRAYAEGLARMGKVEEAERTIADLVERAETTSPTYLLPELLRTQADVMLVRQPDNEARAEACYRRAIAQAQSDGALGWELRAAISLARLWIRANRCEEARALLEGTYAKFTEGFETGDLLDARQLLQSVGARRIAALSPRRKVRTKRPAG
jgi:predicted ATPase/DNA-binding winged helix-turn-helix (wHTH) protein